MCVLMESSDTFQTEWRRLYAKKIAEEMNMRELGVKAIYLVGSVESYNAGRGSDIDLVIQLMGDSKPKRTLMIWLRNWETKLRKVSGQYTSETLPYVLDIHFINNVDIQNQSSFAARMKSVIEPPELLRVI